MKKNIWFLLLLFLLAGCYPTNSSYPTQIRVASATILHTPTNTQPTATAQTLPTATSAPTRATPEVIKECIKITAPPKNRGQGVLVFTKDYRSRLIFQDKETGKQTFVPSDQNMRVWAGYFSPDQKWLIYELDWGDPNGATKFILTKADGIQQKEWSWVAFRNWINFSWLNNHALRVNDIGEGFQSIQSFSFDPFSEAKSSLISDFPGVVSDKNIDWYIDRYPISLGATKGTNIVYDPTLARVLYPKDSNIISLYNLEADTEIAQTSIPGWGRLPKWSSDGKNLAMIGTMSASPEHEALDEFLIVSRDGPEFKRLSDLTSVFKSVHIEEYSWSPDGQHIAFWLKTENTSTDDSNPFELAVLDVQTTKITTYCIAGIAQIKFDTYSLPANIIWSPDGAELVVAQYNSNDRKKFDVVSVNFTDKTAYKVTENLVPIGWMIKEP